MQKRPLGRTGIEVSALCLGSMTWGSQNTPAEGHAQIDRALERGVNFIDTAEMYPTTPISAETTGRTEEIIGDWFAASGRRADVILATKHSGKGFKHARIRHLATGRPRHSPNISPPQPTPALRHLKAPHGCRLLHLRQPAYQPKGLRFRMDESSMAGQTGVL